MSFVAVIDTTKNKQTWSKAIHSLASISDHIKFVVSSDSLTISSINSARTSHADITFKSTFFHEFSVNFDNIIEEGYEITSDNSEYYSFLVNSKHLATLFRNLDANDLDYICLKIHWAKDSQSAMKYKLLIEIKTRKLIIKKYQTNYQPLMRYKVLIPEIYKANLLENNEDFDDERINYILIEQIVPKQFLDMIPSSTEDFKIEIKNEKILFSGYTKQILKDREYLKQPMSLTITLNLDELLNSNLMIPKDKNPLKKCINFRLKDFKNFMNLINTLNLPNSVNETNEVYANLNDNEKNEECFEIYFKNPGDPVLFEFQSQSIIIQYIQITSEDISTQSSNAVSITSKELRKNHDLLLRSHIIHKTEKDERPQTVTEPLKVVKPKLRQPIPKIKGRGTEKPANKRPKYSSPEPFSQPIPSSAEIDNAVTYNGENHNLPNKNYNNSVRAKDIDTDYSDSEEESMGSDEKNGELEYGPTQLNNKPKSIFDDL